MNQAPYALRCRQFAVSSYGVGMRSLFMVFGILLSGAAWGAPNHSDRFDPLLDQRGEDSGPSRYQSPQTAGTGFTVSGHVGFYAGGY